MNDVSAPEVQAFVSKMTNWQRNQWARSGYPTSESQLQTFVTATKYDVAALWREREWKHRFMTKLEELLRRDGTAASIPQEEMDAITRQHADASWNPDPEPDDDRTPEEAALDEFGALAQSV